LDRVGSRHKYQEVSEMAKISTYPVGSRIEIKDPGKQPSNWNSVMMGLIGVSSYIVNADPHKPKGSYRYRLAHFTWAWRHQDLELLALPKLDPNAAFRKRKYEL